MMVPVLHGGKRSPFVRRVELWLIAQGRAHERHIVNIFGADFEAIKAINPLGRVPVLTIGPDEHLIETSAIIDYVEDTADPARRLIPATGEARRRCQMRIAYANAVTEKGVALVYETERRPPQYLWPEWQQRLIGQLDGGLAALEALVPASGWMGGERLDGSDIAAVCAHDFLAGIAGVTLGDRYPRLTALAAIANRDPAFAATQPPRP